METIGSKRSYALTWCMPNNDDDDDRVVVLGHCRSGITPAMHQRVVCPPTGSMV